MHNVDLNLYSDFVRAVTSDPSNHTDRLIARITELDQDPDVNVSLLLTAAIGLGAEGGEFQEIVKKMLFQGKPLNDEAKWHMLRELGDVIWYWVNACRALNIDPNEVIAQNVKKLEARYPGGKFDVTNSENRKRDDI